ncbi:MAG TPA: CocE/NonD family hydrolase, partial [Gemmatimonadota bacterium]|nr:CocE/NonD family hydrolase [Gemmatimonadota bacterium]
AAFARTHYDKREVHIPMRDGVELFAIVYTPRDASATNTYPIVMQRTCYSVAPYGKDAYPEVIGPDRYMMRDKYIFVYEDVRGRYMSGGTWENVRPFIADSIKARDSTAVDEASDTYDTIDWLLKNVPYNDGRVGQWGISYPGFFTTMGALSGHPALVAASPQAPVTNFYFEDFHHDGALTQGYFYTYPIFGIQHPGPTTEDWWRPAMVEKGLPDDYDFQLSLGPLSTTTKRYYSDNFFWQEIVHHPDYDAFWKARAVGPAIREHLAGGAKMPAMLTVGGWFDAEDLYGPLKVYRTVEEHAPGGFNAIVEGPFRHGGWSRRGVEHSVHGDLYFGDSLQTRFQRDMEAPFFHHFLKDGGKGPAGLPEARMFDTGRKTWDAFDAWPPAGVARKALYLEPGGGLAFDAPAGGSRPYTEYVSDPSHPEPSRCRIPTIQGLTMYQYMSDDQRCFDIDRGVATFRTPPLDHDVTLAGPIQANLFVSTSTDASDYVVKLIDVYPMDEPDSPFRPDTAVHYAGYQQLVRGEIMRGRYRERFDDPRPFVPGQVTRVDFRLQDVLHTFRKGHRIMVQVQSTWFPAFDRNPQRYVPNIYEAEPSDFVTATERVYHAPGSASSLEVGVLPEKP